MIILSSSFVLTPADPAADTNSPIIGWRNIVTASNLSAESTDPDFPASNLANPSTALPWKSLSVGEQHVTVLANSIDEIDYLAVARHNFGSAQVAVSLECATELDSDGSPDWFELSPALLPADDAPLLYRFNPISVIGLRLRLVPSETPPTAAVLFAGKLLVLPRRLYVGHSPLNHNIAARTITSKSESGEYLGRVVISEIAEAQVNLQNIEPNWYRDHIAPFIRAAREQAFFFAWRPADYPTEVSYAWLLSDPAMRNQRPNGMVQVQFQLGGIVT